MRCLCGQGIIALLADKRVQNVTASLNFDAVSMHRVVADALGIPGGGNSTFILQKAAG